MNQQNLKRKIGIVLILSLVLFNLIPAYGTTYVPNRTDVGEAYKWDLTEFYTSTDGFYKDMAHIEDVLIPKYDSFIGTLNTADQLLAYYALDEEVSRMLFKGYVYANLMLDLDQNNEVADQMAAKANQVYTLILSATSFATPELLALPDEDLQALKMILNWLLLNMDLRNFYLKNNMS